MNDSIVYYGSQKKKKLFSANVKTEQSKGGGASYWTFEKGGTSDIENSSMDVHQFYYVFVLAIPTLIAAK
ncbi:hypothetical protein BgiBS90_018942, partial [Biomphalaria glabrata]